MTRQITQDTGSGTAAGIILAAGEGKRMVSTHPKVLHEAGGLPLLGWVLRAFSGAGIRRTICVVGAGADEIQQQYTDLEYAYQAERLGSGHAVMQALPQLGETEYTFIAAGDMPLLKAETIAAMIKEAREGNTDCVLLTALLDDPDGYGRVVRGRDGNVAMIVEHKDADGEQRRIREVNASCYCIRTRLLTELLPKLENSNAQGEYYLTDIIRLTNEWGGTIASYTAPFEECLGVNDRIQLAEASRILYRRTAQKCMREGCTLIDPDAVYIDPETVTGHDVTIYPGVVLEAGCHIGEGTVLYPGSRIRHTVIGRHVSVQNSVMTDAFVGDGTSIGPYAYLRPGTRVGSHCRVGDFVELKNCEIGDGTKISHLTYVGDARFGKDINVGCGVVVVNYDGREKYRTEVGDHAFIGCNTNLISPVEVGADAYIAAGTTVTENVPPHVLVIGRSRQEVIEDWQDKRG